ncbi:MAG: TIGR04282 family arsenosugar biosynthesis glycosyltransferase [Gemmatimonadota bacterium]
MPNGDPEIAIFLKAPRPGGVKTRLAGEIGEAGAVALYRRLAEDRLVAARETGWPVVIWYAPADGYGDVSDWLGPAWRYRPQPDGDLGERMALAFGAEPGSVVIVIGGDCPGLTTEVLQQAGAALERAPVVLGPALDGGYYLIGGRCPVPDLFSAMPWSTEGVIAETRRRLEAAGVEWVERPVLRDVDTSADARAGGFSV